jgi:hypothetical protein
VAKDKRQFGKVFMSFDRDLDPLLVIWEAMNLLAEMNMYTRLISVSAVGYGAARVADPVPSYRKSAAGHRLT